MIIYTLVVVILFLSLFSGQGKGFSNIAVALIALCVGYLNHALYSSEGHWVYALAVIGDAMLFAMFSSNTKQKMHLKTLCSLFCVTDALGYILYFTYIPSSLIYDKLLILLYIYYLWIVLHHGGLEFTRTRIYTNWISLNSFFNSIIRTFKKIN